MIVCFSHGRDSGPGGFKIKNLTTLAKVRGWETESVDYRGLDDPMVRVQKLLNILKEEQRRPLVLVGSSMGAFVSIVASRRIRPAGLFLMAPAVYLKGYEYPDITPFAGRIEVVHGRRDSLVPVENARRYAAEFNLPLHILDSGHSLNDKMEEIKDIFSRFLENVIGHSSPK